MFPLKPKIQISDQTKTPDVTAPPRIPLLAGDFTLKINKKKLNKDRCPRFSVYFYFIFKIFFFEIISIYIFSTLNNKKAQKRNQRTDHARTNMMEIKIEQIKKISKIGLQKKKSHSQNKNKHTLK